MTPKYSHLLSPIKIGNMVLKNRMIASNSLPHFFQGPETFPTEQVIQHLSGIAKNGAAVVVFSDWSDPDQRKQAIPDGRHYPMYDLKDESVHNYLSQLADAIHYYNSKVSLMPQFFGPKGYYLTDAPATDPETAQKLAQTNPEMRLRLITGYFGEMKAFTEAQIEQLADEMAERVLFYKGMGFDMCSMHMAYSFTLLGHFLSPLSNFRTDKFGGSLENRACYPLMVCEKIKKLCGKDFPIEVQISGTEIPGGMTTADMVEFGKLAEGLIDIFQVRAYDMDISQPVCFNSQEGKPVTIKYAEDLKKAGVKQFITPVGGYQDLALNDSYIADGKADLITMARTFICEPEYYQKAIEGRGEDVVPCVRCNRCHVPSLTGPWVSVCTVNPEIGFAHKLDKMNVPIGASKKVAVIGGGPAGMKAALVLAQHRHEVTLFEKEGVLGGQLSHTDYVSFKWPLRNYRDYLITQLQKHGVDIRLNTLATPEKIKEENFDAVLAATGAVPKFPDIQCKDAAKVWAPIDVYGRESELGKRVVVVGGSETGVETGMHLAEKGHEVTVLTRQAELAPEATPVHYRSVLIDSYNHLETFDYVVNARTTKVETGKVTYIDADGAEHCLETDDIVLCGGVEPLTDEALSFFGSAAVFDFIGDCRKPGNIQTCTRHAYAAASQI